MRICGCAAIPRKPSAPMVDEPHDHHRPEEPADGRGPVPLYGEQADDDHRRDRYDPFREARVDDLQAFDRRQHRDRRRDHAVTEKQCGAEDSECSQGVAIRAPRRRNRLTRVMRAITPPSPWLSARITNMT